MNNYPFSDAMQFCSKHNPASDVIDVDKCLDCHKPGYAPNHSLSQAKLVQEIVNKYEEQHAHLRGYYCRIDLLAIVKRAIRSEQ